MSVKFHHMSSVPHKEVRIQDDHREAIHKLGDGQSHTHSDSGGRLVTTFNHHGDSGHSHFVTSHRDGDVVHFRDYHTKKHVATVSHADTAEHNPTKSFKYFKESTEQGTTTMGKFAALMEAKVNEAMKKVGEYENGNRKATIHRDAEWDEYRVKHHVDGVHQKDADYHTGDKDDAHMTAKSFVNKTHG